MTANDLYHMYVYDIFNYIRKNVLNEGTTGI